MDTINIPSHLSIYTSTMDPSWVILVIPIYARCMVYLPTKLGDFVRANVGIHIPARWFAYGLCYTCLYYPLYYIYICSIYIYTYGGLSQSMFELSLLKTSREKLSFFFFRFLQRLLYKKVLRKIWLVVLTHVLFFRSVGNVMIPTDEHIFQRGWLNHQPEIAMFILRDDELQRVLRHVKIGTFDVCLKMGRPQVVAI